MYIFDIFKRYKLDIRERKIFDPIRNKYVSLTPEEKIRQQTIKYLIQRLKIPPNRIGVEKSLHQLGDIGNKKRVDICIFDESDIVVAIIECKAHYIGNQESPYIQALDYITSLNVLNYFVVDGYEMCGYHYNKSLGQFEPFDQIPCYEDLLQLR